MIKNTFKNLVSKYENENCKIFINENNTFFLTLFLGGYTEKKTFLSTNKTIKVKVKRFPWEQQIKHWA